MSTPNVESAYRIFSVLNDRGLDLSYTDICKAEIIGELVTNLQDGYTEKWEDAEEIVGIDGFKEVFTHIRTIHRKVKAKETILRELRSYVLPLYDSSTFIDKVLVPYTNAYDVINTSSYQSDQQADVINDVLTWLRRIDNFDWMPPAMAFYNKNKHEHNILLRFLIDLERLAASMMIRRYALNFRLQRYASLLDSIDRRCDLFATDSPLQLTTEEISQTIDRLDGDVYNSGARVYIMRKLDAALSENNTTPDLSIITIEHVLPQSPAPGSQWLDWYPQPEVRKAVVHQLGNLALLSRRKNSQAQNYTFDTKKKYYFNTPLTPFALTTQIINQAVWTPEVLAKRQCESVSLLRKIWRLDM